eukprot:1160763-Pelagomonas_calceolata.AAC.4
MTQNPGKSSFCAGHAYGSPKAFVHLCPFFFCPCLTSPLLLVGKLSTQPAGADPFAHSSYLRSWVAPFRCLCMDSVTQPASAHLLAHAQLYAVQGGNLLGGNLLVPLHGYPIMNETKFPKRIDFNKVGA